MKLSLMHRHIKPILSLAAAALAIIEGNSVASASGLLIEAENFTDKGGWQVDQQFMDLMGSSYLLAHGLGKPVKAASTQAHFPRTGTYTLYVRTYNWTSPWHSGEGPGKFSVSVNGDIINSSLGTTGKGWFWQKAGTVSIKQLQATIALMDMSGFDGRCDALYFADDAMDIPPNTLQELSSFRIKKGTLPQESTVEKFDFVVSGGGIAGICAAVSAARLGLKTALINDRPVLGGNNSSEVRVHLGGRIGIGPYPHLGNLIKEFGPSRQGNAQPADYYEDDKKQRWIEEEKNVTLFPSFRVNQVEKDGKKIRSVTAQHIETGKQIQLQAPIFADCTGDGTVGFLAGADFSMGREAHSEYKEPTAPEKADDMTMGASVQWYSTTQEHPVSFPPFSYGITVNESNAEKVTMGEWNWETGMNLDQLKDAEIIRDYAMLIVYSNWSFLKNDLKDNAAYKNRELSWVSYIAGKRESRRLLGDLVLTENDLRNRIIYPDATAASSWSIDLHYPDLKNLSHYPFSAFKSIDKHIPIHFYPIPFRCFYSRNVENLFMAGRNISVTHVALGTVRVMRTTGMMGEVVGMGAYLCQKYKTTPKGVYRDHLGKIQDLMKKGTGSADLPNRQTYNQGTTLSR